jgi:hypothetical protein
MKRRTLDLLFSAGGMVFAVVLLVLGLVLQNQADFAANYVKDQLGAQQIFMPAADALHGEQDGPNGACLVTYGQGDQASRLMQTGSQAECYANAYIGFHMASSAEEAGWPGATYATLGGITGGIRAEIEAAAPGSDVSALQEQLTAANALRDTMFRGETLRGLLLTTYGFSIFGERAGQAAMLCIAGAVVLFILSIAGFVHAAKTPKDEVVFKADSPVASA